MEKNQSFRVRQTYLDLAASLPIMNNLLKFAERQFLIPKRHIRRGSLLKSGGENDTSHHAGAKQANIPGIPCSDPQVARATGIAASRIPTLGGQSQRGW